MNAHEEAQRGQRAKELLENDIFKESIVGLRQGILDKWRECPVRDIEGQHQLKLMDKLLGDIEGYIKIIAETGKMAEIQLEQERKVAELRKVGIR
jgi:uncharacterized protein YcaQ